MTHVCPVAFHRTVKVDLCICIGCYSSSAIAPLGAETELYFGVGVDPLIVKTPQLL